MTATAERVVDDIKRLQPPDLLKVRDEVNRLADQLIATAAAAAVHSKQEQQLAALRALDGCCNGGNSLQRLLDERARDRDREEAELQAYLTRRKGVVHG